MPTPAKTSDRKLLLILFAVMAVLVLLVSILNPAPDDDPRPTTWNTGPAGAKAAYLLMQALGRNPSRWDRPLEELNAEDGLSDIDAARTTLVLAAPVYDSTQLKPLRAALSAFLRRGGRVLVTGPEGARLLGGEVKPPAMLQSGGLCHTTPEGPGKLAHVGPVETRDNGRWGSDDATYAVAQRCGNDAVVVSFADGKGAAVWWSSALPLTNSGLKQDASLRLLLVSLGEGRSVLFDEGLHGTPRTMWDAAKGLPLRWLSLQTLLLAALLVLSFSRRRGPVRRPVTLPRTSPVEFAESMGDLYAKGEAAVAAVEAARRQLLRALTREVGLPRATAALATTGQGPAAIAAALRERLQQAARPGDTISTLSASVGEHLTKANEFADSKPNARTALALVRVMRDDVQTLHSLLNSKPVTPNL